MISHATGAAPVRTYTMEDDDVPTNTEEIRTADLALAAYLTLEGHAHKRLELLDPHHTRTQAVWVFEGDGDLHDDVECYQDGGATVEPRDFMKAVRTVRDDLYTFLRSNECEV